MIFASGLNLETLRISLAKTISNVNDRMIYIKIRIK